MLGLWRIMGIPKFHNPSLILALIPPESSTLTAPNQDPRFLRNKNTSQAAGQDMTISHFQETPLPVVSHRMGGRYAQTACHSNGQPHAEGVRPSASLKPKKTAARARAHRKQTMARKKSIHPGESAVQ
ncbi:hypothetical protein B0H10DRAFT_2342395 [Mycena sp. CBHHK59/15]|nr:hypothetical protein B0H10DRAFT_2342395 [Mycena sp. CBHHK59/15]